MWYHFPVSLSETCNRIHVFIFGFVYNDDNSIQLVKNVFPRVKKNSRGNVK